MADYIIATDTGSDLTTELYEKYNIIPIKMEYEVDGKTFEDTFDEKELKQFYDNMKAGACPKTSQLNREKLTKFFEQLLKENKPIIYISLGSGISGSCNNAMAVAKELNEKYDGADIRVVDSTLASLSGGMLCIKASENRQNGMTVDENIAALESIKHNILTYYTTKDLTYLHRGGRVSKAGKILGHMLGINPILNLDFDGKLIAREKVRGEKATFDRIEKLITSEVIDPENQTLYISHADALEKAQTLGERYKQNIGFKDVVITNIGTIIGAHTGPGLVAFFYSGKTRV